jgi:hypothetical protein
MVPPKEPEPALAAPGVEGLLAGPKSPISGPRSSRRSRNRSFSHVHVELDLAPKPYDPTGVPVLEKLVGLLTERKIVEKGNLILLAAATLHALSARRFRRVDTWEISPGGGLPAPPPGTDSADSEPVGDLLEALQSGAWSAVGKANTFSAHLSDLAGAQVEVVVRRVHREGRHALTLDLRGTWTQTTVDELKGSLSNRLPVERWTVTKVQYA